MRDLTVVSTTPLILQTALPILGANLFRAAQYYVDLYFVSSLGSSAIAGVGAASTLLLLSLAISQALSRSTVALIAPAVGRKDRETVSSVFSQAIILSVCLSFLFMMANYIFFDNYLALITDSHDIHVQAASFLAWFTPGLALQFPLAVMSSALRAMGNTTPILYVNVLSIALNIILLPILISGYGYLPAMGVSGAGLASTVSTAFALMLFILHFYKTETCFKGPVPWDWGVNRSHYRHILATGIPAGTEMLFIFIYFSAIYWILQYWGGDMQAGFSIAIRIIQLLYIPALVIGLSIAPIVGQNLGVGNKQKIVEIFRSGIAINISLMLLMLILLQLYHQSMMKFFTMDARVIEHGSVFLYATSWHLLAQGLVFTVSGVLQGLGSMRPIFFGVLVRGAAFFIPLLFLALYSAVAENYIWRLYVFSVVVQAIYMYSALSTIFRSDNVLKIGAPHAGNT
jgi:putative MATE family efflux protein